MTAVPKFNLHASNINFDTDEELQAELAKKGGKFFDTPGPAKLVVSAAVLHENKNTGDIFCKGDPTWFNVKLTLKSQDGKEINHWLQVPTTKLEFGEKGTLALYRKFEQFLIGVGEVVTIPKIQGLLEKYFADPSKLVGKQVDVELGYEGPYVTQATDSPEYVVIVKGQPLQDDGAVVRMPDRNSAIQAAKSFGIEPSFLRILKFVPKKPAKVLKATLAEW